MRRIIAKAALDGFIHALLLMLLIEAASSHWALDVSVEGCLLTTLGAGLLSVGIYFLLLRREKESRQIAGISLLSVVFCLLTMVSGLFGLVLQLLPAREVNAGDGLLMFLMTVLYLLFAGILRLLVWSAMAERCWARKLAKG